MNSHIVLKIRNHVPEIIYHPGEGSPRRLNATDESMYEVIVPIAKKLNLVDRELIENDPEIFMELLDLARQSDELYISDLPEVETDNLEFELENVLNKFLDEILEDQAEEYSDIDVPPEIRDEINKNQKADIFASLLEVMYTILIAKTLLAASELGIGTVKLDDEGKNSRLMEKMSLELQKLGVEMVIDGGEESYLHEQGEESEEEPQD